MEKTDRALVWFTKRARFSFKDKDSYEAWKKDQKVYFEFDPKLSGDHGKSILRNPSETSTQYFEVTPDQGDVAIFLDEDGPWITAFIKVPVTILSDLDAVALEHWSNQLGGYNSATIHLSDEAAYDIDDGVGWRLERRG